MLLVQGAPGFEHSFLQRAWSGDTGLEVDSVVRKGKNEQGGDTFYVQAGAARGRSLSSGYPATRAELFAYDAVVLANVEGSSLTPRSSRRRAISSASAAAACSCSVRSRSSARG